MLKILRKLIKSNKGFSLVEAVISVVILGIAIVPISVVFSTTVSRTTYTRKQHEANVLAQEYMEALKNKDFNEFAEILTPAQPSKEISNSTLPADMFTMGLQEVPEGYRIVLTYEDTLESTVDYDYSLPVAVGYKPVDAIVTIPSGYDDNVKVTDGDGSSNETIYPDDPGGASYTDRTIRIEADRLTNEFRISYIDGLVENGDTYTVGISSEGAIRFDMGNANVGGTLYDTTIQVISDVPQELKLYVYEEEDNTVQATLDIVSGFVSTSRNLYSVEADQYRIVELKVEVIEELSGEIMASLTSTMINE